MIWLLSACVEDRSSKPGWRTAYSTVDNDQSRSCCVPGVWVQPVCLMSHSGLASRCFSCPAVEQLLCLLQAISRDACRKASGPGFGSSEACGVLADQCSLLFVLVWEGEPCEV